jgi:Zn ribbon nucleic-acid-binding protein
VKGAECPSCSCRDVRGHEIRGVCDGVLFWSCVDCGFSWPRFSIPLTSGLVQASIEAAEDYDPHTRRSDRSIHASYST